MLARRTPESRSERGAIMVWFALIIVVLLAIGALAIDLGYAYTVKRQLATAADAAALAGAQEAALKFNAPGVGGCGANLNGLVTAAVNDTYNANSPQGSVGNPTVAVNCFGSGGAAATGMDATAIEVKVDDSSSLQTWFARLLGVTTMNPAASATARVFGSTNLSGLRPFLVCIDDAKVARDTHRDGGGTPVYQSYYQKGSKTTVDPSGLTYTNATWAANTDQVSGWSGGGKTTFVNGDYVRTTNTTASGTDVGDRFYYVTDVAKSEKDFKLSTTSSGGAVNVTTSGTVNVTKQAPTLSANWNGTTVTGTNSFVVGTEVWVQGTSGSLGNGALDGRYIVINPTGSTFELSNGTTTVSANGGINVYVLAVPDPTGGCGGASGNWGYSKFDLGSGPNWQLTCLVKYGYGGSSDGTGKPDGSECLDPTPDQPGVDVGSELNGVEAGGDPGNNLGITDAPFIKELIVNGDPILLPVGSGWTAAGNTAEYDGRGALAVRLCAYIFPGNQVNAANPTIPNEPDAYFDPGCGDKAQYLQSVRDGKVTKDTTLVTQWMYTDWVFGFQGQSSDPGSQCPLETCVASLQLLK